MASPGSIKRLTIAVLVNEDVTRNQQDSINRAVSSAVGLDSARGDTISVEPLPLSTELSDKKAKEEQAQKDKEQRAFYMQMAALLLVLLAIIAGIVYYRRKKRLEREAQEEAVYQAQLEAERREAERAAAIAAGAVKEDELTEEEQARLSERQALEELIRNKPEEVAQLIKTWLADD